MKLKDGTRIAIVGGGPAGAFFALYLHRYASENNLHPEITIYQQRNFTKGGPAGCKGCAGILSLSMLDNLGELDVKMPQEVIQSNIEQYAIHGPHVSIVIGNPEKEKKIASIYRAAGPHVSHGEKIIGFDGWLLGEAQRRLAKVENQTVSRIYLGSKVGIEVGGRKLEYDLVVLATGVGRKVPITGHDYIWPPTRTMAQDELYVGASQVEARLGSVAHAFIIPDSEIIFGTLVPKGPLINVSILSSGERPVSVSDFLSYNIVKNFLPEQYERSCGCQPRIAVGPATNYFSDRFLVVGDAVVTRLYKDGIGSALLTARQAAYTVVKHGFAREDLARHYAPFCRNLNRDNRWGRFLFSAFDKSKNSRIFLLTQHRLISNEQINVRRQQSFTKAAWGMFTGSYTYRFIARTTLSLPSLLRFCGALLLEGWRSLFRKGASFPRKLYVGGQKVLILGSGFGGTYALRYLVPSLNRNENVETTLVSDENFFLFSPFLHEVAMGSIETRHIAYPIRRLHWRDRFNFIQASIFKIDLEARRVVTSKGVLNFDYLILALGSVTDISGLASAEENVFTLKTLRDTILIRNHIIGVFEQASIEKDPERQRQLLTFVVCGAGYTGVQLVAELRDFVCKSLPRFYRTIDPANIRVILVEAAPKIVAELHTKLGAYVMKHLEKAGIEVKLRSRLTSVWEGGVEINGVESISACTVIWVAGVVANPRIAELNVARDSIGRVLVNEYLEVSDAHGVYAIGDCAHFEDTSGRPIPPRAHNAVRQARIAASNIISDIRGMDKKRYRYSDPPEIVTLGNAKAVFSFRNLRIYGFAARLMWLVGYSLLITGAYNRIRILMDWLLSPMFGRDTTFLRLTGNNQHKPDFKEGD